jgi:hypothetical protein
MGKRKKDFLPFALLLTLAPFAFLIFVKFLSHAKLARLFAFLIFNFALVLSKV